MEKYLSVMSRKTKLKCVGVIGLAFIGSLLASLWPVRLGELYNGISDGASGFPWPGPSSAAPNSISSMRAQPTWTSRRRPPC